MCLDQVLRQLCASIQVLARRVHVSLCVTWRRQETNIAEGLRLGVAHRLRLEREVVQQRHVLVGGDEIEVELDVPVASKDMHVECTKTLDLLRDVREELVLDSEVGVMCHQVQ